MTDILKDFERHLCGCNLAHNTVLSYVWTVRHFLGRYGEFTRENLMEYKIYLMERYSPGTVNLRLHAVNRCLEFMGEKDMQTKFVKTQRRNYLENVISEEDYLYLKKMLRMEGHLKWYFAVWFMAATGVRVSELLKIKAEHVFAGRIDLYSKGGKTRRIYIPKMLRREAILWLDGEGIQSGYIFLNRSGRVVTPRGVGLIIKVGTKEQMKVFVRETGAVLEEAEQQ